MKLRSLITPVKALLRPGKTVKKYFVYATLLVAILGIIGMFLSNKQNKELQKVAKEVTENRIARDEQLVEVIKQLADMDVVTELHAAFVAELKAKSEVHRAVITELSGELEKTEVEMVSLQSDLRDTHRDLAGSSLKNSFLAERIVEGLSEAFPSSGHLFFSETQENLFRTNPSTANLIYTVIAENAIRIQLIEKLNDNLGILGAQFVHSAAIIVLRNEQILSDGQWIMALQDTQENLEASLALDSRYITTLERQIQLMRKKNIWERVLPSLNIVVGPYYDPFRNAGGFGVALGFGWRF